MAQEIGYLFHNSPDVRRLLHESIEVISDCTVIIIHALDDN